MADPQHQASCEPITQAQRFHYDIPTKASWAISSWRWSRRQGWVRTRRWATDQEAHRFCFERRIPFPPAPEVSMTAPVRQEVAMVLDVRALAAGESRA